MRWSTRNDSCTRPNAADWKSANERSTRYVAEPTTRKGLPHAWLTEDLRRHLVRQRLLVQKLQEHIEDRLPPPTDERYSGATSVSRVDG